MNDSIQQATPVNNLFKVTGMIDNPYDMDIYITTLDKPIHMIVNLATNAANEYQVYLTQDGEGFYKVTQGEAVGLSVGDWYFIVISDETKYDLVNTYTLSTKAVKDAKYENNDELSQAYKVANNFSVAGIIDSASDIDIYKSTFSHAARLDIDLVDNSENGYKLYATQDGKSYYDLTTANIITLPAAGTWYFYVFSPEGKCDLNETYLLKCTVVDPLATDITITGYGDGDTFSGYYRVGNYKNLIVNGKVTANGTPLADKKV